jgi:hypothetical protein
MIRYLLASETTFYSIGQKSLAADFFNTIGGKPTFHSDAH